MVYSPFTFLLGILGILSPTQTPHPVQTCTSQLEVLGAGLSKTGTQSLKVAFETLGYQVYNVESMMYFGHLDQVMAIHETTNQTRKQELVCDFQQKILDTGATVTLDAPANLFVPELMKCSPDAHVLLTVRDSPHEWTRSIQKTIHAFVPLTGRPYMWFFDIKSYGEFFFSDCVDTIDVWEPWYFPWIQIAHRYSTANNTACMEVYTNHVKRIKTLPNSIEYSVKDGWDPLLRMLQLDQTKKETLPDFPMINQRIDMDMVAFFTRLIAYTYPCLGLICLVPFLFMGSAFIYILGNF